MALENLRAFHFSVDTIYVTNRLQIMNITMFRSKISWKFPDLLNSSMKGIQKLEGSARNDSKIQSFTIQKVLTRNIFIFSAFISASFVHRDHTVWQRNPFSNKIWTFTVLIMLILHALLFILQVTLDEDVYREIPTVWTNVVFVLVTTIISFSVTEICKCQEIK